MIQYICLGWIVSAFGPVQFREAGLVLEAPGRFSFDRLLLLIYNMFNKTTGEMAATHPLREDLKSSYKK